MESENSVNTTFVQKLGSTLKLLIKAHLLILTVRTYSLGLMVGTSKYKDRISHEKHVQ